MSEAEQTDLKNDEQPEVNPLFRAARIDGRAMTLVVAESWRKSGAAIIKHANDLFGEVIHPALKRQLSRETATLVPVACIERAMAEWSVMTELGLDLVRRGIELESRVQGRFEIPNDGE